MKRYGRHIAAALGSFLVVILLNFALPRLLPGDPVAYLSGYAEEDLSAAKKEYYRQALHLDESLPAQFGWYLRSLADGSLGYSYKKETAVSALIGSRIGQTLQLTVPALILSAGIGLAWGLLCGYSKDSAGDRLSTAFFLILNAVPGFVIALALLIGLCFRTDLFPYAGLNSPGMSPGAPGFLADRLRHLVLPVLTLTLAALPSRYLLLRNTAARASREPYILYARERGLSPARIRWSYLLKNIAQPFLTMVGMSVGLCLGGSLVVERIFSIDGMGQLLNDAVYTLDYPLMQGILFVTTAIMTASIIVTDLLCLWLDPRAGKGEDHE